VYSKGQRTSRQTGANSFAKAPALMVLAIISNRRNVLSTNFNVIAIIASPFLSRR
jgi:hypothetical protein